MTSYWATAREDRGIGVVRNRSTRIIRHRADEPLRRVATALAVGVLASALVSTTASGIVIRDTGATSAETVADPAPVGIEPEAAREGAREPQSDESAAGRGSGTPDGLNAAESESRAAQVAGAADRATRESRDVPRPAVSATSVPPTVESAPDPVPTVSESPSPSATPDATPEPSTEPTLDPSPSTTDSEGSPEPIASEPSSTGSGSVGTTVASTGARQYGTCVPRVDRKSRSAYRKAGCTS